jgi:2-polyprenyl-3-methyl-5-hydroxy-6-metoxy-1,4-benzoquinol methylase
VSRTAEEQVEADRHDLIYRGRHDSSLLLSPADWEKFDHIQIPVHPYHASIRRLGDVSDRRVLDAGCGDGWLSVILAKRGAVVDSFDISSEAIRVARERADVNGVNEVTLFEVASFYDLPFDDAAYDLVVGQAILHHLSDKRRVAAELHRVLKPGGLAVFSEPLGNSLMLERFRLLIPVRTQSEERREWRRQLKHRDLRAFEGLFDIESEEFHFFSRMDRIVTCDPVRGMVGHVDRILLKYIPWLRYFARAIVVELRRAT